jgi:hypothetical protein
MKRLFLIFGILLWAAAAFGASVVGYSSTELSNDGIQVVADVTADTDGSVANTRLKNSLDTELQFQKGLALRSVHVYFGSPAPTNDSDFTLEPVANSYDILGGAGANTIDAATNSHFRPLAGGAAYDAPVYGPQTLKITGNSVNGAKFKIIFDFVPQ